jgi:uncharacterized protein
MIQIQLERDEQGRVKRLHMSGHATFAEQGKDVVCAAVSSISICMINAIEKMFGVQVHTEDVHPGHLECFMPTGLDKEITAKIALLLEAMVVSLQMVAEEYPLYVTIQEQKS